MTVFKPVRGLTALALILAAGMAFADDGTAPADTGTDVSEEAPVDDLPADDLPADDLPPDDLPPDPAGDPDIVVDDGWVTIDFGCFDCSVPFETGEDPAGGDAGSGEDTGTGEWVDDPALYDPVTGLPGDPVYMTPDMPTDAPTGTPRDADGEIAPNERDPVMLPTSDCGGCEAEGGLPLAVSDDSDRPSRHPALSAAGNLCTDPVMYAGWLCAWQGFARP